jgi:hypothetical protein
VPVVGLTIFGGVVDMVGERVETNIVVDRVVGGGRGLKVVVLLKTVVVCVEVEVEVEPCDVVKDEFEEIFIALEAFNVEEIEVEEGCLVDVVVSPEADVSAAREVVELTPDVCVAVVTVSGIATVVVVIAD